MRPPGGCLSFFFFSSRRRHTRFDCDWSSDVCSSDLARPVFADIEPDTFNISTEALAGALKPSTKAVISVDLFGQMAPIEAITDAAGDRPVIEDAAQSIGARRKVDGKWVIAGEAAPVGAFRV